MPIGACPFAGSSTVAMEVKILGMVAACVVAHEGAGARPAVGGLLYASFAATGCPSHQDPKRSHCGPNTGRARADDNPRAGAANGSGKGE